MILIATFNDDNDVECFEVTTYLFQTLDSGPYLEADIDDTKGIDGRMIILQEERYLDESDEWKKIQIFTDSMNQLLNIEKK